jgi:hypothetical protein
MTLSYLLFHRLDLFSIPLKKNLHGAIGLVACMTRNRKTPKPQNPTV